MPTFKGVTAMECYVRFIVRHRVAVVVATLVITALLGSQLRHVHVEVRRRANFPDDHPYVRVQDRIFETFGGEGVVVVGVVANRGDIFTPEILGKVSRITDALRETPGVVETSLLSIAAPYVKAVVSGADDVMDVRPLLGKPPATPAEIERVRNLVRQDKLFRGNLVSADETAAVVVADFDQSASDVDLAARIEQIVAPERDATVTIALAGAPILSAALTRYTAMIRILFPIAVAVIALVHYEAFRTFQAMFLPLITAFLSVIWAVGIMGALRLPMDTWSAMTPVLILAVAAGHAVQILKRYYEEYAVVRDNEQAVVRSLCSVGPVMLIAGIIASAGFGSLATFGITSVRVFGLLLASGILSALVIEMSFTPACRCLLPAPREREMQREGAGRWLDRGLDRIADLVVHRPRLVLAVAVAVLIVSVVGALELHVDNSFRLWFAPSTQVRKDDALLNEKLPGTATLRILVEGREDDALLQPSVLEAMSDLQAMMAKEPAVGGVTSIVDHVKRMHQAMNGGDATFYAVPDDDRLIAQYLFLYGMSAGPDGLAAFIDGGHRRAVIRALSKTDSALFSRELLARLDQFARTRFQGLSVTVGIAGGTLGVQTAMNDMIVHEKVVNIIQVSAIIFVLCAMVLGSVVGALFVLTPLVIAVAVNLGIMGWAGIWLDMSTAAITAMGVSIGADFAIYLLFRIREEWAATASLEGAVRSSLRTSGKAIFFVSSAVALGYLVLPLSGFSIWTRLGILTAMIVSVSALATLTIVPSLVLILQPRFIRCVGIQGEPIAQEVTT